jgi:twitching motility two-component system response regulator PilH
MSRTFLIVDDSETERTRMGQVLAGAGHRTAVATNGAEALEAVKHAKFDAIFMDINMPGMDGYAATRALKAEGSTKDIPVVLVSVKSQKADRAWGQMLGACGHVGKPYTDDELLDQVRAL